MSQPVIGGRGCGGDTTATTAPGHLMRYVQGDLASIVERCRVRTRRDAPRQAEHSVSHAAPLNPMSARSADRDRGIRRRGFAAARSLLLCPGARACCVDGSILAALGQATQPANPPPYILAPRRRRRLDLQVALGDRSAPADTFDAAGGRPPPQSPAPSTQPAVSTPNPPPASVTNQPEAARTIQPARPAAGPSDVTVTLAPPAATQPAAAAAGLAAALRQQGVLGAPSPLSLKASFSRRSAARTWTST